MPPEAAPHRAAPLSEARRGFSRRAVTHASGLYRRPLQAVVRLHAIEQEGEAGETPFIAILGLLLFFVPVFLVMAGLAFAGYYLA